MGLLYILLYEDYRVSVGEGYGYALGTDTFISTIWWVSRYINKVKVFINKICFVSNN